MIEILVVISIIALLAALLLPALSAGKARGKRVGCINNLKQLGLAAQMYTADNNGKLAENLPENFGPSEKKNVWMQGNMRFEEDATNQTLIRQGKFFPYANQVSLYRCPADPSRSRGAPRVRSYSMNGWMGSRFMEGQSRTNGFRTFVRENELTVAGPALLWLLIDEHESSIDDAWFLVTMDDARPFASFPSARHDHGYGLNFADGHVEANKLRDPNSAQFGAPSARYSANNMDWIRLKQRTTIR